MQTYDALAALQERDPRLRIHSISTAAEVNIDEIQRLTTYLFDRCPKMDDHNLALIRGDRKNPSLQRPNLQQYQHLYEYVRRLWALRERKPLWLHRRTYASVGKIADGSSAATDDSVPGQHPQRRGLFEWRCERL